MVRFIFSYRFFERVPPSPMPLKRGTLSYLTAKETSTLSFPLIMMMSITSVVPAAFPIIITTAITFKRF